MAVSPPWDGSGDTPAGRVVMRGARKNLQNPGVRLLTNETIYVFRLCRCSLVTGPDSRSGTFSVDRTARVRDHAVSLPRRPLGVEIGRPVLRDSLKQPHSE